MAERPATLLRRLRELHQEYGGDAASRKLELLDRLARRRLASADAVLALHEVLCFLQAYPDDATLLRRVDELLAGFHRRGDLRRHAEDLFNSGVAGTPTYFRFCWTTALWLARRWPRHLSIYWKSFDNSERLDRLLGLLVPYTESLALEEADFSTRGWIDLLKGPDETDAVFLLRRLARLAGDDLGREATYDDFDMPFHLAAGDTTPSRTRARFAGSPVVFQTRPLDRARPVLGDQLLRAPASVQPVPPREARKLIDLAREAMIARERDLYAFRFADPNDVRLVDCGGGLQFAAMGVLPERRLMLDSVYGYLTLKNGVPIGYVLSSAFFNSAEVAYNVFETWRGAEAGHVYGQVLAVLHRLFRADAFTIDPYQLGHGNTEGLESGAWWFYYKLGFRPIDADVKRVLRGELRKMRANPRHRSSIATLEKLSAANVFWYVGEERSDVRGRVPLDNIGVWVSHWIARRFGSDREKAVRVCSREAMELLGVRSQAGWSPGERLAWKRWSPLMLSLPGVARWSASNRRALAAVARAKGGRRESVFVLKLDAHRPLRRALMRMAATPYDEA